MSRKVIVVKELLFYRISLFSGQIWHFFAFICTCIIYFCLQFFHVCEFHTTEQKQAARLKRHRFTEITTRA
jgi:hypothetical protein